MLRIVRVALILTAVAWPAIAQNDCPADTVVQPAPHPNNAAYPDPRVSATCTGGNLVVTSNGIPGFEFQAITPAGLAAQNFTFTVPVDPTMPATASNIPMLGTVAFTVTGLPIYGPNEAAQPANQAFGDPIYNGIMDFCLGHTGRNADYHFHALLAECIGGQIPDGEASPLLGYALDGHPIFGPTGCLDAACTRVVELRSSWVQVADPTTDAWSAYEYRYTSDVTALDECNGRIGPDGTYRYHATTTFPYVLGCYAGSDVLKDPAEVDDGGDSSTTATGTLSFLHPAALVGEGQGTATLWLTRSAGASGELTAAVSVAGGDVTSSDTTFANQTVSWGDGEAGAKSLTVSIADDAEAEGEEELWLALDALDGSEHLGAVSNMTLRIVDDDLGSSACTPSVDEVCLAGSRFGVRAEWVDFEGTFGRGTTAPYQTEDSGLFTFFDGDNLELLVKVLDGCAISGSRWVFAAAATNVGYVVTVHDSQTGTAYQFSNALGARAPALADTAALPGSCS